MGGSGRDGMNEIEIRIFYTLCTFYMAKTKHPALHALHVLHG